MKYDFRCPNCGMVREVEMEGMVAPPEQDCYMCGERMRRVYGISFIMIGG